MEIISKIYKNKKILITGHTGFKGSWLSFWLNKMGAKVYGVSDDIPTNPSLFKILNIRKFLKKDYRINIKNYSKIKKVIEESNPDIIFHLAGQSLVARSYKEPLKTFLTNTFGTLNILNVANLQKKKNELSNNYE